MADKKFDPYSLDFLDNLVEAPVTTLPAPVSTQDKYNTDWLNDPIAYPPPSETPSLHEQEEDDYLRTETSWSFWGGTKGVGRTIARMPVRATADIYNALNEVLKFGRKAKWDETWLGEPQNAVEDITADIGSWMLSFFAPGGAVSGSLKLASKASGLSTKASKVAALVGKTEKGKKVLKVGKIAGEGAVKGAVADYLSTDTGDLEGEEAFRARYTETLKGALIGSGVNLAGHLVARTAGIGLKKMRALKKIKEAAEGKGGDTAAQSALRELKKVIDEEEALKSDVLSELNAVDEFVEPLDLDKLSKTDEVTKAADEFEVAPEKSPDKIKPEDAPKKEDPKDSKTTELEIDEYIERAKSLPEQINRLIRLNLAVAEELNPRITELFEKLAKSEKRVPTGVEMDAIRDVVSSMETSLVRYRKIMELRAKAGNITGKALVAFKGNKMDFTKPMTYKPEVAARMGQIDSLLELVRGVKNGTVNEDAILKGIKKEITELDGLQAGKSLSEVIDGSFSKQRDESVVKVWDRYKQRIADSVINTLRKNTKPAKASLDEFSDRVTNTLTDAVKTDKPITKAVNKALRSIENILANPDKYKESIRKLIKEITATDNITAANKEKAVKTLTDIVEGHTGKTMFEGLPQRQKMVEQLIKDELSEIGTTITKAIKEGRELEVVDEILESISKKTELNDYQKQVLLHNVKVQLSEAVTTIHGDIIRKFISKELYQKFGLREQLKELDEMGDKSIEDIRKYLTDTASKVKKSPEDIALLKKEVASAKKSLETKSNNAFVKELLTQLSHLQQYRVSATGRFELFVRAFEKFRLNMMLFSPRTWTVGIGSAGFNLAYQPFKQALKTYYKARNMPGEKSSHAEALQLAMTEIRAVSEYWSNWSDIRGLLKQTWKNHGRSGFNPKSFRRHEEDLIDAGTKGATDEPLKVPFKDRKTLIELVQRYGVDSTANRNRLDAWLEDFAEGEPTSKIGQLLDPLFSTSFRMMGIMDEPFKVMGTMRALRSTALQDGLTKELSGKELDKHVGTYMKKALKEKDGLPMWAKNEEFDEIEQLGLSITYQDDYADKVLSGIARSFAMWSRSGNDAYWNPAKIAARLAVPFIKTPTAIAQWTLDHLPGVAQGNFFRLKAGLSAPHMELNRVMKTIKSNEDIIEKTTSAEIRKNAQDSIYDLNRQQEDLNLKILEMTAEANAVSLTATTIQIGIVGAVAAGTVTGTGSYLTDDQRRRLIDEDWRPNSIRIGDKWVSYARLEPWSTFLSLTSDIVHFGGMAGEGGENLMETDQQWYNVVHASFVENLSNKYFIRGLHELIKPIVDEDAKIENTLIDYVSSLSPTVLRDLAMINDEFQTQASDIRAKMLERSFGVNPGQYRRNLLGEKVKRVWSMAGAWGVISPIVMSDIKDDYVLESIANLRGRLGQTRVYNKERIDTRMFRNPSTNQTLFDAWMEHMSVFEIDGKTVRDSLERVIDSVEFDNAPIESIENKTQTQLVAEVLSEYRGAAWKDLKKQDDFTTNYVNKDGELWTDIAETEDVLSGDRPGLLESIGLQ